MTTYSKMRGPSTRGLRTYRGLRATSSRAHLELTKAALGT